MALKIPDEFMPPEDALITKNGRYYPLENSASATTATAPPSASLRDFFEILRRRKVIAFNAFVLVLVFGVIVTLMTKPVFSTSARLLVEGKSNTLAINNGGDPLSSVFQPPVGHDVDTQIEMLRSSAITTQVYKKAGIKPSAVDLAVRRVGATDVIEIAVTSNSRDAANSFAQTLPKVYESQTRDTRLREVSAALDFAQRSLKEQNAKLLRTEAAFEKFKNQKGVVDANAEVSSAIESSAQARSEYVAAQGLLTKLSAQLSALQAQRASLSEFTETPLTTTNPALAQLNDQLAQLKSQRDQLVFLYKPTNGKVRQIDAQIESLQQRISKTPPTITNVSRAPNPAVAELDNKIGDVTTDLQAAQKSLAPLRARVEQQGKYLGSFNDIQRQQAQLQRDLDSSSNASKTLAESVLQLTLRKEALDAAGAPVSTMETAPPAVQIAPRLGRGITMAILLGLVAACVAALLQDSLDDHLHNENEARALLDTSILGYFPMLQGRTERPILDLENPDRNLLESFRALRSNVQFTLVNKDTKASIGHKLLVTSSVPAEGKSYVASNLAIAMALDGRRVILVDADLHRPRVHVVFDLKKQPGLTDVLVGETTIQKALQRVGIPGLRVLSAGTSPPNPAELLNSAAMDAALQALCYEADIVILDSPPMLATADAQVLSSKVDGVIYVMQLGRVARSAVQRAFELLKKANASVVGIVFNKVEQQNSNSYGGYYYSDYSDDEEEAPPSKRSKVAKSLMNNVQKAAEAKINKAMVAPDVVTPDAKTEMVIGETTRNNAVIGQTARTEDALSKAASRVKNRNNSNDENT